MSEMLNHSDVLREGAADLSQSGAARRDAMLGELISGMQSHHARRRARRRIVHLSSLAVAISIVALAGWFAASGRSHIASSRIAMSTLPIAPEVMEEEAVVADHPSEGSFTFAIVRTDAAALDRWRIASNDSAIVALDDGELLRALDEIDRPAGLVRVGGRVWLTANVVDEPRPPLGG